MKLLSLSCLLFISYSLLGQNSALKSFESNMDKFLSAYVIDGYVDYKSINSTKSGISELVTQVAEINLSGLNELEKQSFYINTYNLLVIDQIVKSYPTVSVKDISGFFDRTKYYVAGKKLTLNEIEKDILLKEYKDSRFHFVLVCGAKDCPKIWNRAFTSEKLNEQLNSQTRLVLNDRVFLKETKDGYLFSQIFKWNRFEFGGKKGIIKFINTYRTKTIDQNSTAHYYDYDWTLNDTKYNESLANKSANNSFRYVTSAAIPKGGIEIKMFNNLYSQILDPPSNSDFRTTYFTTSLSFLYGKSNRFNIGFTSRYRRVYSSGLNTSPFDVFRSPGELEGSNGFTAIGPLIRWAPIKKWSNFSIQSSLTFPLASNLSGGIDTPFLDWAGPVFLTQFFNDVPIEDMFSLFTEVDILIEEIGGSSKSNRVSIPATVILSFFPVKNLTIYGLLNYSPYLVKPFDYFTQLGAGVKYQISRNFEIELLGTSFSNKYLKSNFGRAATYNIGFRYSR